MNIYRDKLELSIAMLKISNVSSSARVPFSLGEANIKCIQPSSISPNWKQKFQNNSCWHLVHEFRHNIVKVAVVHEFRHNIFKVAVNPLGHRLADPQLL